MTIRSKFLWFILLPGLVGAGFYLKGGGGSGFFQTSPDNRPVTKKISPVKPEFSRNRETTLEGTAGKGNYTFFETLTDSEMKKFVGLNGRIDPVPQRISGASVVTGDVGKSGRVTKNIPSIKTTQTPQPKPSPSVLGKPSSYRSAVDTVPKSRARFAVQVSSFREEQWARSLKKKLQAKGYPVFILRVNLSGKGTWYRVNVGEFPDENQAQAAARRVREEEKLNTLVWNPAG